MLVNNTPDVLLDGTNIKDFNMYISEDRPPIPTPEQDIEHIEIKGRNGSLTKKYGFKDIEYPLVFQIYDEVSFKSAFRQAKQILFNAKKLAFADDPGIYYKIKSLTIDTAENEVVLYGQFTVNFILDPFAYEETDILTVTQETTLNNPGYESEPYIKAYVSGTGNIYLGDQMITIKDINGIIEMDSSLMNAYKKDGALITNLNDHMIGDFLVIPHGQSVVKFDGDITQLDIDPRWRWL